MSVSSVPAIALAGISFYVGLYHFLSYARGRYRREDLTFAVLCLATGLYAAFCAGLYSASSVVEGARWQRAQFLALAVFVPAFLWFASDYTHQKPTIVTYALTAFYVAAFVAQAVDRSGLTWLVDRPSVKEVALPLGIKVAYFEAQFGPLTTAQSLMGMVASTYILWIAVRFSRRGHRREARPLLWALGFMYLAAFNDTAVSNGLYAFIYLIEYGYMAVILVMTLSMSRAVAEAVQTRGALRESEERFRSLVEATSDWVWEVDSSGAYTYASPKCRDLLGYEPAEMLGKTPLDFMPAEERIWLATHISSVLSSGRPFQGLENTALHRDGHEVILETSGVPVLAADGKLVGYRGIDRDITERRRAMAALADSEERYRGLVENALAGIFTVDDSYRFVYVNSEMSVILGYSAEELIGLDFRKTLSEESLALVSDRYVRRQRGEQLPPRYEITVVRRDGTTRRAEMSVTVVKDAAGRPRTMGQLVDITERTQAEEEIRRLNAELEQRVAERTAELEAANRELEAFSYSVSHDLRAPLRAIDGFASIVVDEYLSQMPAELKRHLTTIRENSQQMGRLIDDLLDFSRLGRHPLKTQTIAQEELVREVLDGLESERRGRDVEVSVGPLPDCRGDPALVRQVWVNLLSNALKFTRKTERGRIEVGCHVGSDGERVYFVKDNGAGFDMSYVGNLFGVFRRLHGSDEYEGTGVGLAIVRRIIDRHGGRIWAEGRVGEGATFWFTL